MKKTSRFFALILALGISSVTGTIQFRESKNTAINIHRELNVLSASSDTVEISDNIVNSLEVNTNDKTNENEDINEYNTLFESLDIINPITSIQWTVGKCVNGTGVIYNNRYQASSQIIPCTPGDRIERKGATHDAAGKFLTYYVSEFSGDTFIRRTELNTKTTFVVIDSTTTHIYIGFGRYASSGIALTQEDIDTYVNLRYLRHALSVQDEEKIKDDITSLLSNYVKNDMIFNGESVNDITQNSFIYIPSGTNGLPTADGGYFVETILYGTNPAAALQNAYRFDNGLRYYRRKVSGKWRSWILNDQSSKPSNPLYYAFGDSLTYGAVWTSKEEAPYYQITQADLNNQIPTRIAHAIGAANNFANKGVGGAYFVGNGDNKIITAIKKQDLSNAKIITIAGGRNDSANPLGDKNSSIGDGTICGAVKEILEYVTDNYKKLQIVWIGVTPNTKDNNTVFTKVYSGGWSLNSFDEKVSELCADYGVPYVDWKYCTYIRNWADFSGAGGVYSHPDNEESYLQMGNYIAGRVATYYRG